MSDAWITVRRNAARTLWLGLVSGVQEDAAIQNGAVHIADHRANVTSYDEGEAFSVYAQSPIMNSSMRLSESGAGAGVHGRYQSIYSPCTT